MSVHEAGEEILDALSAIANISALDRLDPVLMAQLEHRWEAAQVNLRQALVDEQGRIG